MKQGFWAIVVFLISTVYAVIPTGADYLIICPDEFVDDVQPLADWKTKKGMLAKIATLSETGSSSSDIKAYITAAQGWTPAPKFILLVGDPSIIPMVADGSTSYGTYYCDHYYEDLDGDLYRDVFAGRFPANESQQIQVMVAKTLRYEKDPPGGGWLDKGCTKINEDGDESDSVYHANTDSIVEAMTDVGYTLIEQLVDTDGDNKDDIEAAITNGCGVVSYRGQAVNNWYTPFAVTTTDMHNGFMTPVIFSITCYTIRSTAGGSRQLGDVIMANGTVDEPNRAVAYLGTTSAISGGAHLRGEVLEGIAPVFYGDTCNHLAVACEAGRLNTLNVYSDTAQYDSHVLLGDPDLPCRRMTPAALTASHPSEAYTGETNTFRVDVLSGGASFAGAFVCLYSDGDIYQTGTTNMFGRVTFSFNPAEIGTLWVTATAKDHTPYEGHAIVMHNGPNIAYFSNEIDDSHGGDLDGLPNPGENIDMVVALTNDGLEGATGVSATLTTTDPLVTIERANSDYGSIAVGAIVEPSSPFRFSISEHAENGHVIDFDILVSDDDGNSWTVPQPDITVDAAEIQFVSLTVDDYSPLGNNNSTLEQDETGMLEFSLENVAMDNLANVNMVLKARISGIAVEDSTSNIDSWGGGVTITTSPDHFLASLPPWMPAATDIPMWLIISGNGNTYDYLDTLEITIPAGGDITFTGPDGYGYFAYSDEDVTTGRAPTYDWYDISSVGTRLVEITNVDDGIHTYSLPFTFKFYGVDYNQVSICSNGFASLGVESWTGSGSSDHERPIPTVGQASGFLAGFWDNLNTAIGSGITYAYNDASNHRYIIEFEAVPHDGYASYYETFQMIFYDPAYHETVTGDGEMIVLYDHLAYTAGNTVGIESHDEINGLEYVYHNSYAENAEELVEGRAIKFTTNPPTAVEPWIVVVDAEISEVYPDGNGNYFAEDGERVTLFVTLKNQGTVTAYNVNATISESDPAIYLESSTASFGNLNVDAQAENTISPYIFTISGLSSDRFIDFDLTITANSGGYTRNTVVSIPVYIDLSTGDSYLPKNSKLSFAHPNPFNSRTEIYTDMEGELSVSIHDIKGNEISRFSSKGGNIPVSFKNQKTGIYLYTLENSEGRTEKGKMVYIK